MKIKRCIKNLNRKIKKLDMWDIGLIKLAVAAAVIVILRLWSAADNWLSAINIWWIVLAFVVFAIRPLIKYYGKN